MTEIPDKCKACKSVQIDSGGAMCKRTGMLIEGRVPDECPVTKDPYKEQEEGYGAYQK